MSAPEPFPAQRRPPRRVAALDLGTNSTLLLVAERDGERVIPLLERATITRLGRGVDRAGVLSSEGARVTLECLAAYRAALDGFGVDAVGAVGTSALRDASAASFLEEATRVLGVRPRVISGEEEARLTFAGALAGLALSGQVAILDVGGGSTEVVLGDATRLVVSRQRSLDIGSVRLTERHLRADPPAPAELAALRDAVSRALETLGPWPLHDATLVGVAGTFTTLAGVHLGLEDYDPGLVHGTRLDRAAIEGVAGRLARLPLAERRRVPGLDPARADVIVAGAFLVVELLSWAGATAVTVSDRGVRWGLALELFGLLPDLSGAGRSI